MSTTARTTSSCRPYHLGRLLLSILLLVSMAPALAVFSSLVAYAASPPKLVTLSGNVPIQVTGAQLLGHHQVRQDGPVTIELVLKMNHENQVDTLLSQLYDRHSPQYRHWLSTAQFASLFGPTPTQVAAAKRFLTQAGLTLLAASPSPFLLRAQGSLAQIEAAFHVSINDYRSSDGQTFFANGTDVQIPASLSGIILGVLGLNNIPAPLPRHPSQARPNYGGGPGGTGLTPSQIAGIYNADPVYRNLHNAGQGVIFGLFELSNYTPSDIPVYENTFFPGLPHVPVVDVPVDGGTTDHHGAGEVELDIEMQIALAPLARGILVYQAPNTLLHFVDLELQIAADNLADAVSISWGICEPFQQPIVKQAENLAFRQMALQGQSVFAAAGDAAAFDCSRSVPSDRSLQVDDPASQPFVTGVGGTSFAGTFDPGTNPNPTYPGRQKEHVWFEGCFPSAGCVGGGGGVSRFWAKPSYQVGPGVVEPGLSRSGAYCGQRAGVLCREVPDVSLNSDPGSGYAVYCTDPVDCGSRGWQQIGGTSAAAPLWSTIAALMDSFQHKRVGLFNFFLYRSDNPNGYSEEFHDITIGNNGFYPARSFYDMATGVGTANIYDWVRNV